MSRLFSLISLCGGGTTVGDLTVESRLLREADSEVVARDIGTEVYAVGVGLIATLLVLLSFVGGARTSSSGCAFRSWALIQPTRVEEQCRDMPHLQVYENRHISLKQSCPGNRNDGSE